LVTTAQIDWLDCRIDGELMVTAAHVPDMTDNIDNEKRGVK
jgi:hypothetical protein